MSAIICLSKSLSDNPTMSRMRMMGFRYAMNFNPRTGLFTVGFYRRLRGPGGVHQHESHETALRVAAQ